MKRRAERRGEPLVVRTCCEPGRLAAACWSDAYARLVSPVRRPLGSFAHAHASSQQSQAEISCVGRSGEEGRQCS
jgi:hypothetical protein